MGSFPKIIKEQETIIKQSKTKIRKNSSKGKMTFQNCVATITTQKKELLNKISSNRKGKNPRSNTLWENVNTEDDVAHSILNSLHSNRKCGKFIKRVMKTAVNHNYEIQRAIVRYSAIGSQVTFVPLPRIGNYYNVNYSKGIQGKGMYQEEIKILSISSLKDIIQLVYHENDSETEQSYEHDQETSKQEPNCREMLRPRNMAQLSPRTFWSIWYHCQDSCSTIEESLEYLFPMFDWSFLQHRTRSYSEKALENKRQENEKVNKKLKLSTSVVGIKNKDTNHDRNKNLPNANGIEKELYKKEENILQASLKRIQGNERYQSNC